MWDGNWGGLRNEMGKNGDILWDRKEWERYGRGYIDWIGDSKEDGAI